MSEFGTTPFPLNFGSATLNSEILEIKISIFIFIIKEGKKLCNRYNILEHSLTLNIKKKKIFKRSILLKY
jgi:hypothetical protein